MQPLCAGSPKDPAMHLGKSSYQTPLLSASEKPRCSVGRSGLHQSSVGEEWSDWEGVICMSAQWRRGAHWGGAVCISGTPKLF